MNSTIDNENNKVKLDDTFFDIDLSDAFKDIYHLTDNTELKESFRNKEKQTNLRNDNYKQFYNININKINQVEESFKEEVSEINGLYKKLSPKKILEEAYGEARKTKIILEKIYSLISDLYEKIKQKLKEIEKYNENMQSKIDIKSIKNMEINEKKKNKILRLYEDLLLYSSNVSKDTYENFIIQVNRKKMIDNFYQEAKLEIEKRKNQEELKKVNDKINNLLAEYNNKINILEETLLKDSKYKSDVEKLRAVYNKILSYDKDEIDKANRTLKLLGENEKINVFYNNLCEKIAQENEKFKADESKKKFENKINREIVINSLNYINEKYLSVLDKDSKKVLKKIEKVIKIDVNNYDEIFEALKIIIDNIWSKVVTSAYDYNKKGNYNFIVTKTNILDPKQEAFLFSKNMFKKFSNISDFQIGFICSYNDNILYFTEKKDIMLAKKREYINYKTPYQIESEFTNDDILTRIALDGNKTKVEGVYIINSSNKRKYKKALELSNSLNIPLIEFKK